MNRFLVVDTVRLNSTNRFVLTGAVREGLLAAGMRVYYPSGGPADGLEIMKVELITAGSDHTEHYLALLLRLDDVTDSGLDRKELWLGKEIVCE